MSTNRTVHARGAEYSLDEVARHLGIARSHLWTAWRRTKDFFDFAWRWIRNAPVRR